MTRASSRMVWGAIAIIIVAAIAYGVVRLEAPPLPAPTPVIAQKLQIPAPPPALAPAARQSAPAQSTPLPAAPPQPAKPTVAAKPSQIEVPRFDIVRVDPNGNAVLAGRAAPDSEVTVLDGTHELGHVTADKDGNWVLVPDQALPPGQGQLSLSAKAKNGTVTRSDGVVAMLVPARPPPVAAPPPAAPAPAAPSTESKAATQEPAPPPPAKVEPKGEAPIAVLVPKEGPATALQLPPLPGKGEDRLSMDIIEYGTKGDVILEGRSAPDAQIDAYLDNKKIGSAKADSDGKWRIVTGDDVPAGRYKLKLESRNSAGKQVALLTMPFERASLPAEIPSDLVIVQPGNSLWRIARRSYGRGIRYVEIYHANKGQITNPKMIFPGQLLQIPGKS